jgi:hypothetical protein
MNWKCPIASSVPMIRWNAVCPTSMDEASTTTFPPATFFPKK